MHTEAEILAFYHPNKFIWCSFFHLKKFLSWRSTSCMWAPLGSYAASTMGSHHPTTSLQLPFIPPHSFPNKKVTQKRWIKSHSFWIDRDRSQSLKLSLRRISLRLQRLFSLLVSSPSLSCSFSGHLITCIYQVSFLSLSLSCQICYFLLKKVWLFRIWTSISLNPVLLLVLLNCVQGLDE